ncbi:hypothetical protein G9A89_008066 [Geosiphon pyriformis]|nr:hypothetical protein G9A89_008066 [Geosiphon pyriformis]
MAKSAKITVNANLKKSTKHSDQIVVVKKIPIGTLAKTMKPILLVSIDLNDRFVILKYSFTSLTKHVDKLAKKLDTSVSTVSQPSSKCQPLMTPLLQNQRIDIVISKSLSVVTSGETVVKVVIFD